MLKYAYLKSFLAILLENIFLKTNLHFLANFNFY